MSFKVPTAIIDIPSKGLVYPEGHPLREGKIEMVYPGAQQENILANDYYKEQNVTFDKLFESMMITKFDYNDLITGDKDMIFVAARVLMFGKNYEISYLLPGESSYKTIIADLTTLKPKVFDESLFNGTNEFEFILPITGNVVTYKLLTHKDEKLIDQEVEGLKNKISEEMDKSVSVRWCYQIVAVNGDRSTATIRDFVNSGALITLDSNPLRQHIAKSSPGVDLRFDYTSPEGKVYNGLYLPITKYFFRPSLDI